MITFLDELKRRKVVRVAAVWTITLIVWLAVLGLPLTQPRDKDLERAGSA